MQPKGSVEILATLVRGPKHFSELAKTKVGSRTITRVTLSVRLKTLEKEGFIERVIERTYPPTVRYFLTEQGAQLLRLELEAQRRRRS